MGERGAGVAGEYVDVGRAGLANVGEDVAGDGLDGGVDLEEADAVPCAAVGGDGSRAKPDDADVAGAGRSVGLKAAVAEGKADAGILGVIGGGRAAELVSSKYLGAVLDGAVGEDADGGPGKAVLILRDAEGGVEVADGDGGVVLIADVEHDEYSKHGGAGRGPENALAPVGVPGSRGNHKRGEDKGGGQVVVEAGEERGDDADEERAESASRGEEEVEKGGLGGAGRAQRRSQRMQEEAGDEESDEEERDAEGDAPREADPGEHVGHAAEDEHEEAGEDAAMEKSRKPEGQDQGEQVDGEGQDPEERDGGDVGGEVYGDGAELHGGGHGQEDP